MANTVLIIAVIAGLALSVVAITLGLFMLLSKSHTGDAEGAWQDKLKVKGPVGLFVFCIGVTLFVIIMRQIAPPLLAGGDNGVAPTPDGARVEFTSPPADFEINFDDDLSGSVRVAGLGDNELWIVSRHNSGGSYYPVDRPIVEDGNQQFVDQHVGDSSDQGSSIVYFAVVANADCVRALAAAGDSFRMLPSSCIIRDQRVVRVR